MKLWAADFDAFAVAWSGVTPTVGSWMNSSSKLHFFVSIWPDIEDQKDQRAFFCARMFWALWREQQQQQQQNITRTKRTTKSLSNEIKHKLYKSLPRKCFAFNFYGSVCGIFALYAPIYRPTVCCPLMQKLNEVFRVITFLVSEEMNYDRMTWSIALNSAENSLWLSLSLSFCGHVVRGARRHAAGRIFFRSVGAWCGTLIWDFSTTENQYIVPIWRRTFFPPNIKILSCIFHVVRWRKRKCILYANCTFFSIQINALVIYARVLMK